MTSLTGIIKADYLQRARSYSFLITLLASVCFAYTFLPTAQDGYSTVRVGEFVGQNNTAWVGHVTAIMASTFLWLIGFYLVNNGIKRDIETGVGQIIATTSISNFKYLLAKALSNFLVLLTIVVIIMLMSISLVLIRGSEYSFNLPQFLLPYFLCTIPSIFFVSALAVLSEVIFGKYSILQNISFFILFCILVANVNANVNTNRNWLDIIGTKELTDGIANVVNARYTDAIRAASVGFDFGGLDKKKFFLFEGTNWSTGYIYLRLFWTGIAFLLIYFASKLFHRFDIGERRFIRKQKQIYVEALRQNDKKEIQLSGLPLAQPALGILPIFKTEFLLLIRKGPKWFWAINAAGFIALFFIPIQLAHQFGLPLLWFLQINRWSDIATKEKYYNTHYFTYASYQPLQRLFTSQILAAVLMAVILSLPVLFRYIIASDLSSLISILCGAFFVVGFSVCSGVITGGKRFFEIVYFMLVYLNLSSLPFADYFGALNHSVNYNQILASVVTVLFLTAYMVRNYEVRNQ